MQMVMLKASDDRFKSGVDLAQSVLRRLKVCLFWLLGSLSQRTLRRASFIALGELTGTILQALAFVAAAKLVIHFSIAPDPALAPFVNPENQTTGFIAVGMIAFLISLSGLFLYKARRHAIRLAADFETERYAEAIALMRRAETQGAKLSPALVSEITGSSPRFMGRMLMALLGAIPSSITAALAFFVALWFNFSLTAMLVFGVVVMAPFFLRFTIHSSHTSRRMKEAGPGFSAAKKALNAELSAEKEMNADAWRRRIEGEVTYQEFMEAYQARIALAPFTQLLNAISLSAALVTVFFWFVVVKNAEVASLTGLVISLVLLRFFMQGVNIVMSAMTMMGSFYPYFANYITLASGAKPTDVSAGGSLEDLADFG